MFFPPRKPTCPLKNSSRKMILSFWNTPFLGDMLVFRGVFFSDLAKYVYSKSQFLANPTLFGELNYRSNSPCCDFQPPTWKKKQLSKIHQIWIIRSPPSSWVKLHKYLTHHTPQLSRIWPCLWCHKHHWVVIHRSEPHRTVLLATQLWSLDV